uniref:Uncharacterized protein n=1 Tax=Rhizophora mucronata TaxID=61149 RepID=A0A2P2JUH4_RHIMU
MSVAIGPGATQFAVMLVPFSSFASIFVIASTAAFVAVYVGATFGLRELASTDDSIMILPPPPLFILFAASLQHKNEPLKFTLQIRSKSSREVVAMEG